MRASWHKRILDFKKASGTSRGILKTKTTYYLKIHFEEKVGIGECSTLPGLSIDHLPSYEGKLNEIVGRLSKLSGINSLDSFILEILGDGIELWPSIRFALEMAYLDLKNGGQRQIFPSPFTNKEDGIPINGLVWMGDVNFMKAQIASLLSRGFRCLKMKIGAINFEDEISILRALRKEYPGSDLILRVDANGAFSADQALEKLKTLSDYDLHSIEQPIMAGQMDKMAELCAKTPLPIALDEELIKVVKPEQKARLLIDINPQYIILKPSLLGGLQSSDEWIDLAKEQNIGWWATSALESNIGLSAIAQWTYTKNLKGHQGLGTGSLYTNNIASPLEIEGEKIFYRSKGKWDLDELAR